MFDPFNTTLPNIATTAATEQTNAPAPVRKKRAPKHDFQDGLGRVFAHRHINGGGWVADTAKVDDKVHVGKRASVYHHAVVKGNVVVQHYAQVCGGVTIDALTGSISISHHSIVGGRAEIASVDLHVYDHAKIFGGVISGTCKFKDHAEVRERPTLRNVTMHNKCWIGGTGTVDHTDCRDHVRIYGAPQITNSVLRGWVIVKQSAIITNSTITSMTSPMTFYNGLSPEQINAITENADITGSCIIGGQTLLFYSEISCTLHAYGSPEFVRSKIRFSQPVSMTDGPMRYEIVSVDDRAKFIGTDFHDYNRFRATNVPFDLAMRAPAGSPARGQPFDFDSISRPRRVTAMEPK